MAPRTGRRGNAARPELALSAITASASGGKGAFLGKRVESQGTPGVVLLVGIPLAFFVPGVLERVVPAIALGLALGLATSVPLIETLWAFRNMAESVSLDSHYVEGKPFLGKRTRRHGTSSAVSGSSRSGPLTVR
jgi:hypothetical protein